MNPVKVGPPDSSQAPFKALIAGNRQSRACLLLSGIVLVAILLLRRYCTFRRGTMTLYVHRIRKVSMPRSSSHPIIIQTQDLSKSFKLSARQQRLEHSTEHVRIAVDKLSFVAFQGEIFGLLGPNGAGKTTTLRMLATLIRPDEGDALVAGRSISRQPEAVRATIGFLTSELKLEDFFTPSYLFDFFATLHGVPPDIAAIRKAELFKRFGIDEFAEVKVANLSTGMKQKASLVISIVHDPPLIIFDEPTNGLDVLTAKVVTDYLAELRDAGKTIVLSTHIFSLAERLCDRVGVIIDGRMAAQGTVPELTKGRSLEQVFFDLYVSVKGKVA